MEKEKMKDAFEHLNPTKQQEKDMWERLSKSKEIKYPKSIGKTLGKLRYVAAAAIALAVITVSGFGINAATDGAFMSKIKDVIFNKPAREDIVDQAGDIQNRGIEVYASDILYIDENWLVFGNLRGILIYDLKQDAISGTIDTQAIDCMYFDGERKQTHVLEENQKLILFNTKDGVPYGSYYQFDFTMQSDETLKPSATGNDVDKLKDYYEAWKKADRMRIDTFDKFSNVGIEGDTKNHEDCQMYSKNSLKWTDSSGEENISYLAVQGEMYMLNTYHEKTKQVKVRTILIESNGDKSAVDLPKFTYTGEDKAIKAICEYVLEDADEYLLEGQVRIPYFIIFREVKKQDNLLVFGNFYSGTYLKNGNILEEVSGSAMPACFHLKQSGDGYVVENVDTARDGSYYAKDIEAFTRGYSELASKYFNISDEDRENACKQYLKMYVTDNELPIQYYKEFGWDPVDIFAE